MSILERSEKIINTFVDATELSQAATRTFLALFYALFLYAEGFDVYLLVLGYAIVSFVWLWWVKFTINFPLRKILGLVVEHVVIAVVLWNVGYAYMAPFVLLYLWSIVGSGHRFGLQYALFSFIGMTISFWINALFSPHWNGSFIPYLHLYLSISLISLFTGYITVRLRYAYSKIADYEYQIKTAIALSNTDTLTGLCNRKAMNEALRQIHLRHKPSYILFIDLDNFKRINDLYGHQIGDQVLINISRRLQTAVRGEDIVCRYAGDEFVVIIKTGVRKTAENIAQRIKSVLNQPISIENDKQIVVTGSIGVSKLYSSASEIDALRYADKAMYAAKREGRNTISWYEEDSNETV